MSRLSAFNAAVFMLPVLCAGCEGVSPNELAGTTALVADAPPPLQAASEKTAKENQGPGYDLIRIAADIEARGDKATALALYERAASVPGSNTGVRLELAAAYQRMQRIDDALRVYRSILQSEPENGAALLHMGWLLVNKAKLDEGIAALAKAAPLLNSSLAYNRLGVTQTRAGRPEDAVQSLKKAQDLAPEDLDIKTNLALAASIAGKSDAAVDLMKEVVQQPRAQISHRRNLVVVLGLANKDAEALALESADLPKSDIQTLLERAKKINKGATSRDKAKTLGTIL